MTAEGITMTFWPLRLERRVQTVRGLMREVGGLVPASPVHVLHVFRLYPGLTCLARRLGEAPMKSGPVPQSSKSQRANRKPNLPKKGVGKFTRGIPLWSLYKYTIITPKTPF